MDHRASFQINAELENLARLRRFVQETATDLAIAQPIIDDVLLAVNEAVTNIILHGYHNQPGIIEVTIDQQEDSLVVCLRDRSPPFDPTTVSPPDLGLPLEKRPFGKMGIYLMRKLMDEVIHRIPPGGGNELILIKKSIGQNQHSDN